MEKVLISSCLVGNKVRYNGGCLAIDKADEEWLYSNVDLIVFCPEVSSGLPIPRAPAEIIGGVGAGVIKDSARVIGDDGIDLTNQFLAGANNALKICQENGVRYALLAENSPSCGSSKIYDGTFTGRKVAGRGITAERLQQHGIQVFSQNNIASLREKLKQNSES